MKKRVRKFSLILVGVLVGINAAILISGNYYLYKTIYYNFANIGDYQIFPQRIVYASDSTQIWALSENYNDKELPSSLDKRLKKLETVAFLVTKGDSLVYETYSDGYNKDSYANVFSVTKSYMSALTGIAIQEGHIKGLDQPVGDFLPYYNEGERKNITFRHLLTMSSGLNWNESYMNPFSVTTEAYYGSDLPSVIRSLEVKRPVGRYFRYKSGDTQILGMALREAIDTTLSGYLSEKIWQPVGARRDAVWNTDKEGKEGIEKAYCCLGTNARDLARFGALYLNQGAWNGKQLVPEDYVRESVQPAPLVTLEGKPVDFFGLSWWIVPSLNGEKVFYCRGILGQYVVVIPSRDIVIVRLGRKRGPKWTHHHELLFEMVKGVMGRF